MPVIFMRPFPWSPLKTAQFKKILMDQPTPMCGGVQTHGGISFSILSSQH